MKKTFFYLLTLFVLVGIFSSCGDGDLGVKHKIARIYTQNADTVRHLDEVWTWNNDLLVKITSETNGYFLSLTYDKNRKLSNIYSSTGENYTFFYEGSKVKKVEVSRGTTIVGNYDFEYQYSKVARITVEELFYKNGTPTALQLRFILPQSSIQHLRQLQETQGDAKSHWEVTAFDYEWDSYNNITKEIMSYVDANGVADELSTCIYRYDNKINPFYNNFAQGVNFITNMSMHNPISEDFIPRNYYLDRQTKDNTYIYNGDLPIEVSSKMMRFTQGGTVVDYVTTFYEYEN